MGKKGTPHRKFSKEEKQKYIKLHLDKHISIREIERQYGIQHSLVSAKPENIPTSLPDRKA